MLLSAIVCRGSGARHSWDPAAAVLMNRILVFGDKSGLAALPVALRAKGVEATTAHSPETAMAAFANAEQYQAVLACLSDFAVGGPLESAPMRRIAVAERDALAQLLSALGSWVDDGLLAPVQHEELLLALRRPHAPRVRPPATEERIIGTEGGLSSAWRTLEKAAKFDADVLITGESGTGKELFARAIHNRSQRRHGPFVAINCAAIPAGLVESRLFGHVRGAFTDAHADQPGVFARAHGGTLFLDEVGDFPIDTQVKLLRSLQQGEIQPLGSEETTAVDVRVVSATSRDLAQLVEEKRFRDDLFYRLAVISIELPPLRYRRQDLSALVDHFVAVFSKKHEVQVELAPEARQLLLQASWPGNVRQLQNAIERLVVLAEGPMLGEELVRAGIRERESSIAPGVPPVGLRGRPLKEAMRSVEASLIAEALSACAGKRSTCAKALSISQRALLYKIKEHNL